MGAYGEGQVRGGEKSGERSRAERLGALAKEVRIDVNNKKSSPVPYSGPVTNPRQLWYRTVRGYSRLQLTFEKDKLPALAALAERMQGMRVGDRCLAGYGRKLYSLTLCGLCRRIPSLEGQKLRELQLGRGRPSDLKSCGTNGLGMF